MSDLRALLLDFGGVLTSPLFNDFDGLDREHGLPSGSTQALIADAYGEGGDDSAVAKLERGEMELAEFDGIMGARLGLGEQAGVFLALFATLVLEGSVWAAAQHLRRTGIRTVLVSNSWGMDAYPRQLLEGTFDEVVISGEVGLRKPQPAIYELALERVGVPAEQCVFVDDHPNNLKTAASLGMTTVLHRGDHDAVVAELEKLFEVDLGDLPNITGIA